MEDMIPVLIFAAIGAACIAVLGAIFGPELYDMSRALWFLAGAALGAVLGAVFGGVIMSGRK